MGLQFSFLVVAAHGCVCCVCECIGRFIGDGNMVEVDVRGEMAMTVLELYQAMSVVSVKWNELRGVSTAPRDNEYRRGLC